MTSLADQPAPVTALAMDTTAHAALPIVAPLGHPPGIPVPEYAMAQPTEEVGAERLAAVEQMVQDQMARMQTASEDLAQRITALEQTLTALDKLVRSLPPAEWHRLQYARMGEWEQRVAALERVGVSRAGAQPWNGDAAIPPATRRLTYAD